MATNQTGTGRADAARADEGRSTAPKRKMFFRMVTASLVRRRSRMVIALLAIAIGSAILTGLLTIYYDVPRQLGAQFRNYGANMILQPEDEYLTSDQMSQAVSVIDANALVGATGFRYQTVRIHEQPISAAGMDMAQAQKTDPYWSVDGAWPSSSGELMVGANVAEDLYLRVGDTVEVTFTPEGATVASADGSDAASSSDAGGGSDSSSASSDSTSDLDNYLDFTVTGILSTGGSEENYVYMPMEDMEQLTGESGRIDIVELSVSGSSSQLSSYMDEINSTCPGVHASLVKRIAASETTVLSKLQYLILLVTIVVLALTLISVGTTMTATVTERRHEIGLKKALGATDREIIGEFMGETLLLGGVGGLLGGFLGFGFAQLISMSVFASSISFRPLILPLAVVASLIVTTVACLIPIRNATQINPALVLKGE